MAKPALAAADIDAVDAEIYRLIRRVEELGDKDAACRSEWDAAGSLLLRARAITAQLMSTAARGGPIRRNHD